MIKLTCLQCGKTFEIYPSRFKKGEAKYCSRKCSDISKKLSDNVKCSICGKTFHVKPHRLNRLKDKEKICCSKECAYELKKTEFLGEKNHQYGLKGELNSTYKGDLSLTNYGYLDLRCLTHPFKNSSNKIFLHRIIMEEHLRANYPDSEYLIGVKDFDELFLDPSVVIHHKDLNKLNNTIENLEIMSLGDHTSLHVKDMKMKRDEKGRYKKIKGKQKGSKLYKRHIFDAGLDIKSNEEIIIEPNARKLLSTDLYIKIPNEYVGIIWSRSGLSVKHGIQVGAGCIDSTYTGEVKILLYNFGDKPFKVNVGDRIAQLLTIPINIENYEYVKELDETDRGENGFGSTGV